MTLSGPVRIRLRKRMKENGESVPVYQRVFDVEVDGRNVHESWAKFGVVINQSDCLDNLVSRLSRQYNINTWVFRLGGKLGSRRDVFILAGPRAQLPPALYYLVSALSAHERRNGFFLKSSSLVTKERKREELGIELGRKQRDDRTSRRVLPLVFANHFFHPPIHFIQPERTRWVDASIHSHGSYSVPLCSFFSSTSELSRPPVLIKVRHSIFTTAGCLCFKLCNTAQLFLGGQFDFQTLFTGDQSLTAQNINGIQSVNNAEAENLKLSTNGNSASQTRTKSNSRRSRIQFRIG